MKLVDAATIDRTLTRRDAVAAIEDALRSGWDIENDHERLFAPLAKGEFLLMPSQSTTTAGVKVATIAPENTSLGLPKIHAWYLLFDRETLQPIAMLDGTRLTTLRTPAATTVAIAHLLAAAPGGAPTAPIHLAVIGSGPQAIEHVRTIADTVAVGRVSLIGRTPDRVAAAVAELRADGLNADAAEQDALRTADVIVTATSATTPVVDLGDVREDAVVAAIGSHGTENRELGADLVRAADLVVEARGSAFRENGNLAGARSDEEWASGEQPVANLADLVRGAVRRRPGAPAVYTGVGMAWEDLAVVEKIMEAVGIREQQGSEGT